MKLYEARFGDDLIRTYYITKKEEVAGAIKKLADGTTPIYGLDIETAKEQKFIDHKKAGLCPLLSEIRLVQIYNGNAVYIFDCWHIDINQLRTFLYSKRFVAHYAKFELAHFTAAGFPNLDIDCSMLLSMLIDRAERSPFEVEEEDEDDEPDGMSQYRKHSYSLEAMTARLFKVKISKEFQTSNWNDGELAIGQILYAALDAILTWKIAKELGPKVKDYEMLEGYKLLKKMQYALIEMELTGFPINWEEHNKLSETWAKAEDKAWEACRPHFGETNMNSSPQMNTWLKEHYKSQPEVLASWPMTKTGAYSFGAPKLIPYVSDPAIASLLEFKRYSKLCNTYGYPLQDKKHPKTGRLHTDFSSVEARTGRLSSRNPNLQNAPRDPAFRHVFQVREGYKLVVADFNQIEVRVAGELSKDPEILRIYNEGRDIYREFAARLLNKTPEEVSPQERQMAKAAILGLEFGMGAKKFRAYASLPPYNLRLSEKQAEQIYHSYHRVYHVYSKWCERERARAERQGFARTPAGRMRKLLPDEVYTKAPNTKVQGGAAEVIFKSMVDFLPSIERDAVCLVNSVHDEIIVEARDDKVEEVKTELKRCMEGGMKWLFPNATMNKLVEPKAMTAWSEAK